MVTSLGTGKQENWRNLTAGVSGIHHINAFDTEGLRTTIAGTVDFITPDPMSAPALSYALAETATREALDEAGLDQNGFPGPLFLAAPPVEMEWQHKFEVYEQPISGDEIGYDRMLAASREKIA